MSILGDYKCFKELTVGTRAPSFIIFTNSCPRTDPLLTSSLSKSPVEIWVNSYLATILSHKVPLPLPGPPKFNLINYNLFNSQHLILLRYDLNLIRHLSILFILPRIQTVGRVISGIFV